MTQGAPLGHLFVYAVPLVLGNWLQLAYNAVDSIIAGRFIGQDALAAEGVAGPIMNLVILAITGVCIGAGVLMSESFGADKTDTLRETLATTLLFGAALCCGVALVGIVCTPWILQALAVPESIGGGAQKRGGFQNTAALSGFFCRAERGAGSGTDRRNGFRHCMQCCNHCGG